MTWTVLECLPQELAFIHVQVQELVVKFSQSQSVPTLYCTEKKTNNSSYLDLAGEKNEIGKRRRSFFRRGTFIICEYTDQT